MGVTFSSPFADFDDLDSQLDPYLVRSISKGGDDSTKSVNLNGIEFKSFGSGKLILQGSRSFRDRSFEAKGSPPSLTLRSNQEHHTTLSLPESGGVRHEAALKLQKTYKSFRTRRQLADCAVIAEQRWWKLLDFAELKRSSVSFFEVEKPETAVSRWSRARTRAAKVGKGLSKDEKARKLALQHWLEAIDPRHRYGHNLQFYYSHWLQCDSQQPFFYWLDVGEGRNVNLERCPRSKLQQQCIKYLGPTERSAYEVTIRDGKFIYKQSGKLLDTREGPNDVKWIFVLSTLKILYIGQKKKGAFQHSSFMAGGATISAGRLVVEDGILKAVWPHSGHYLPTEENFEAFMEFLLVHNVSLSGVQRAPDNEEEAGLRIGRNKSIQEKTDSIKKYCKDAEDIQPTISLLQIPTRTDPHEVFFTPRSLESPVDGYETADESLSDSDSDTEFPVSKQNQLADSLSCKWTTGAGPRIGCVRDYPSELQLRALEEVCLSPRRPSLSEARSCSHKMST